MPENEPVLAVEDVLAVTDLAKSYRGGVGRRRGDLFAACRLDHRAAGRQRRRQDHDHRHDPRPGDAVGGDVRVLGADMPRQRYRVLHRMNFESPYIEMPMRLTVRQNLTVFGQALRRARSRRAHRRDRRASSISSTCSTARPASSRRGRRPAPRSPRRCSIARRCCSSTSRPPPSTPTPPTGCAPLLSAYRAVTARRCCSRPTTCWRSSGCASASSS